MVAVFSQQNLFLNLVLQWLLFSHLKIDKPLLILGWYSDLPIYLLCPILELVLVPLAIFWLFLGLDHNYLMLFCTTTMNNLSVYVTFQALKCLLYLFSIVLQNTCVLYS